MIFVKEFNPKKIAIHHRPGSFSDRWIEYCEEHCLNYSLLNCYDSDILEHLKPFDALLWHWNHLHVSAKFFALSLIMSFENSGKTVFPDSSTCWHYDDKIAQKYLLESVGAPLIPCHVFYNREKALEWVERAEFPKVFKLRAGAGSSNVQLVSSRAEARDICRKAFGGGFKKFPNYFSDLLTKVGKARKQGDLLIKILKTPSKQMDLARMNQLSGPERGYVYFQEFIPDNDHDTRVTIIGNRAFAFRRMVRKDDFRASGSGIIDYDPSKVDLECVRIAFETARRIRSQSLAFDFVKERNDSPGIVEISYCYDAGAVHTCPGHWNHNLNWHEGNMWPQDAILEDLINVL